MSNRQNKQTYRGRFAPSATGALHLGSVFNAVASFLQARSQQGSWLLRIDDLDTARCSSASITSILTSLERFGLYWDETAYYQSQNLEAYQHALEILQSKRQVFYCTCSRKQLIRYRQQQRISNTELYPGFCRQRVSAPTIQHAIRLHINEDHIHLHDQIQGSISKPLSACSGDFIVKRSDGLFAYQLASVVDDQQLGISEIVRGYDLINSSLQQIYLQSLLEYTTPDYAHFPIIVNQLGIKLSKQHHSQPVSDTNPAQTLYLILSMLQQHPPTALQDENLSTILQWAIEHWNPLHLLNYAELFDSTKSPE